MARNGARGEYGRTAKSESPLFVVRPPGSDVEGYLNEFTPCPVPRFAHNRSSAGTQRRVSRESFFFLFDNAFTIRPEPRSRARLVHRDKSDRAIGYPANRD